MGTLAALLVVGVFAAWAASGFQTFESTATWDVTLRNDTKSPVVVVACQTSACTGFRYTRQVPVGKSVHATDYGDGRSWWLVRSNRGRRVGCLSLDSSHRVEGYVIRMSRIRSCPA
jgi:hypothetical protein